MQQLTESGQRNSKRGRYRDSPPDTTNETFVLWPVHSAMVEIWALHYGCSRSRAIRMMIDAAGTPSSRAGRAAARRQLQEGARWEAAAREGFPRDQMLAAKRARAAEAARKRRAAAKAKNSQR
jgi:hypothetical protein